MYKILIVEDEWFTRNSLMNAVEWAKANCEVIAGAENGIEALNLIDQMEPDIVISDIKMDVMDGLELCENINSRFPNVKVVFITGYSEFEYAQNAIKLGVKDFILKPTDPNELLAAVERVVKDIENKKHRDMKFTKLQKIVDENIPVLRGKFLLDLVNGKRFDADEIINKQEFLSIDPEEFYIIVGEIDNYDQCLRKYNEQEKQIIKLMIREICEAAVRMYGAGYFVEKDTNMFLVYIRCTDVILAAETIRQKVADMDEISVSMGISLLAKGLESLSYAYEQAVQALRQTFYIGNNCIVNYTDIKRYSANMIPSGFIKGMTDAIIEAVKKGDLKGAKGKLDAMFTEAAVFRSENHIYIRNIAFELAVLLQRLLISIEEEPQKVFKGLQYYEEISSSTTINDIKDLLCNLVEEVAGLINEKNKKTSESVINKIIDYIHHNYSREVTLDELGKTVYMNPKYVCRLIKKETGSNFSDILLDIRMEKAKKLLHDPKIKSFEVAEKVGISDSRYFSKVFKKMVGLTPTEYKQQL